MTVPWGIVRCWAGVAFLLYGFGQALAQMVLPSTCNATWLAVHAAIWQVARKSPQLSTGSVTFTGAGTPTIPAGTLVKRGDGVAYATDSDVAIASGTATVTATAVAGGIIGNCAVSTILALVSPIGGVNSAAAVATGGMANGTDLEDVEVWRGRVVDRIRLLAQGGSAVDYTLWTEATASVSVSKVWPLEHTPNPGDVTVYFLVTGSGAARIPSGGNVTAVQTQLNGKRPINDNAIARAPADDAVPFTIHALTPNTTPMKAAVEASLTAMFDRSASLAGTIANATARTAIGNTPGLVSFVLASVDGGGEDADIVAGFGEVSRLGTVTYT